MEQNSEDSQGRKFRVAPGSSHRDDYENAVKLIIEVIKKLDKDTVARITYE